MNHLKLTDNMAILQILAAVADNTLSEMPNEILIGIITSLYETSPDSTTSCAAPLGPLRRPTSIFESALYALNLPACDRRRRVGEAYNKNEGVSGVHGSRQVSSSFFVGAHTRS